MENLEIGQSCLVFKVITYGGYDKDLFTPGTFTIGKKSTNHTISACLSNINGYFLYMGDREVQIIGKLTITKLK